MANTIMKVSAIALAITTALTTTAAQAQNAAAEQDVEVIEVRGIRGSLKRSMLEKKEAANIADGISAEDLGKFPDQNVAESLQRITGVSIDRSGGEGQFVSVRGFGPQFNSVLVNGRQIATENAGREFSFDTLAAEQITGADVFKSPMSNLQEGGIGATINVRTARPFDFKGFKAAGTLKGVYDDLSGETAPQASALITNTFMEDRLGLLLSVAHQERSAQNNMMESRYYRPGVSFTAQNGKEFNDVNVPQNFDLIADSQERSRTSVSSVVQYAPNDLMTITADALVSQFEVDSDSNSIGHWFSESNFIDAEVDPKTNTINYIENANTGATDFIRRTFGRNVDISAYGLNVEYVLTDEIMMTADVSTSTAKEQSGGDVFFTVIGYNNAYTWDNRDNSPSIEIQGGPDAALDASKARAHYNERNGWDREDTINEMRVDFEWSIGGDLVDSVRWGVYNQNREKQAVRKFVNDCDFYCGYGSDVPDSLLTEFTADNFFSDVPNTWLTYDVDAYNAYRGSEGIAIIDAANPGALAAYAALGYDNPQAAGDAYTVEEDILSAYVDVTLMGELNAMPWTVNAGVRYSATDSTLSGVSRQLLDLVPIPNDPSDLNEVYAPGDNGQPISADSSYSNFLPNINVKLELQEDMLIRAALSQSLTRPTMDALNPSFGVTVSRPNNNQATGGNAELKPFVSTNWDLAYEYYYADASMVSVAAFGKSVEDFITSTVVTETFDLQSGSFDIDVRRPRNGETASVTGFELAWTHAFESGFGFQANATVVDSDAELDNNSSESFALEGLGDSQNIVAFYEKGPIQTRLAFNNRSGFMQNLVSPLGGTEPLYTESFGQWDISASYDITETISVFFEGINITGEETRRNGRYDTQLIRQENSGTRYGFGVRASL